MKVNIVFDQFHCPFPDIVDKERFEVIKTERENCWVLVRKDKEENINNTLSDMRTPPTPVGRY